MSAHRKFTRNHQPKKKGIVQMTQPTAAPTPRQMIEKNMESIQTQRANFVLQKQQAEETIVNCNRAIAQAEGAIMAYQESLKLFPPDPVAAPPAAPPAEPPAEPPAASPNLGFYGTAPAAPPALKENGLVDETYAEG